MAIVEIDVEGVGVVLVPDAALATERRDAALSGCARAGEAHNVLRLRQDLSGLLDFFFVIHNAMCFSGAKLYKKLEDNLNMRIELLAKWGTICTLVREAEPWGKKQASRCGLAIERQTDCTGRGGIAFG